jgi:ribokinase
MHPAAPSPPDVVCVASWNADLVAHVPRLLARGETLRATGFDIGPGGKGSNAAVACARQGARVALIARIGDDEFGRMGQALWAREGIATQHVACVPGERTGVAQIMVYEGGDNSIAVFPGATDGLRATHATAAAGALGGCKVVMASCEVPLDCTLEAFRIARAAGALTVFNPAPARALPDALLVLADVLTPNETELQALAGNATDHATAARALQARGAGAIVVTLGASGCVLYRPGQAPLHIAGHAVTVADTIGAGDTFTGALAAALVRGDALADAVRHANAAGALSVRGHGAIAGMPQRAEVLALLAQELGILKKSA